MGKEKRRRFTPEFEAEAVRMVLEEGRSISEVAKSLEIWDSSLGGWVKQAEINARRSKGDALTSDEREELRRQRTSRPAATVTSFRARRLTAFGSLAVTHSSSTSRSATLMDFL